MQRSASWEPSSVVNPPQRTGLQVLRLNAAAEGQERRAVVRAAIREVLREVLPGVERAWSAAQREQVLRAGMLITCQVTLPPVLQTL